MSEEDSHVTLAIWSHSHAPPLKPAADISFDLRRVPNPPKHIRDSYDGRSKRLREHLLHDATFANLLKSAMEQILQVGQGGASHEDVSEQASQPEETCFVAEGETTTSISSSATGPSDRTASEDKPSDDPTHNADDEEAQAQYDSDQEEPNSSPGEIEPESDSRLLRISCFCERGRHRSVAFAEELGRMAWPRGWGVLVQHRDVDGQGGGRKRSGRSGRDGKRGGKRGLAFGFDSDGEEV